MTAPEPDGAAKPADRHTGTAEAVVGPLFGPSIVQLALPILQGRAAINDAIGRYLATQPRRLNPPPKE